MCACEILHAKFAAKKKLDCADRARHAYPYVCMPVCRDRKLKAQRIMHSTQKQARTDMYMPIEWALLSQALAWTLPSFKP